ncbi:hypothetical protein [Actinoplanes utahensis]|uniref:hypothetical protein n=1 Tax=Actinoplanes utahensis TaxID=1869 RepID=UPI0013778355|nr:hypothetical protein [Actinoplanes utahensis]
MSDTGAVVARGGAAVVRVAVGPAGDAGVWRAEVAGGAGGIGAVEVTEGDGWTLTGTSPVVGSAGADSSNGGAGWGKVNSAATGSGLREPSRSTATAAVAAHARQMEAARTRRGRVSRRPSDRGKGAPGRGRPPKACRVSGRSGPAAPPPGE